MLDNIIDCKFGKNNISKDFLDNIFNSDLLIIDDLGTESINNIKFTELFNVINTRILSNKKTIISTNLSMVIIIFVSFLVMILGLKLEIYNILFLGI